MRTLYITQEYAPFFAEGGLALASSSIPAVLERQHGLRHDIVLPYYPRLVGRLGLETEHVLDLPDREVAGAQPRAAVHRLVRHTGYVDIYLIRADAWYDRPGIYCDDSYQAFADETQRAAYFGLCVADWVSARAEPYGVVHGNDWQSGAAMAHLRHRFPDLPQVLTVHNGMYRGDVGGGGLTGLGLPQTCVRRLAGSSHDRPSLLLAAVHAADAVVTCSAAYAAELLTPVDGDPLPEALRRTGVRDIPFGVDEALWDPGTPGRSSVPFDAATVDEGKRSNKLALQKRLGLREDESLPLIGVCSRLVPEKGVDLLLEGLGPLVRRGLAALVLVGPATAEFQEVLSALGRAAPEHLAHVPAFDQDLAWLTYAGADLTVMPSRTEPGGLNQLIAYRYGTVPVVSPVGGLGETVTDLREHPADGTGFFIPGHTAGAVRDTVLTALRWMDRDRGRLTRTRRRLMAQTWSWTRTARRYAELYAGLVRAGSPRRGEGAR
jgi:starch synthase